MLPWNVEDLTFDETRFAGTARLFPLPNLVMFPHVMQPLHIHEPRYRKMLSEALDHDGLIAMSILTPGCETEDQCRPAISPIACLGKIVTHQRLDDGHYNLLMLGMRRVRIVRELPGKRAFRKAEVELLDDHYSKEESAERAALQTALTHMFQEHLPDGNLPPEAIREALSSDIPLGVLTDLVSFAMPLSLKVKYALLAEPDVDRRAWMLLESLENLTSDSPSQASHVQAVSSGGNFPPPFSLN